MSRSRPRRIYTTLDAVLEQQLRAEAIRRDITRARLLREAAAHYIGHADGARHAERLETQLAELAGMVGDLAGRVARLERQR